MPILCFVLTISKGFGYQTKNGSYAPTRSNISILKWTRTWRRVANVFALDFAALILKDLSSIFSFRMRLSLPI